MILLQVVGPLDAEPRRDVDRRAAGLPQRPVLRAELDGLAARRAVEADLPVRHDAEAVLEPDRLAVVEAEEVTGQVAEIAVAERPAEAVGDAERALELRQ